MRDIKLIENAILSSIRSFKVGYKIDPNRLLIDEKTLKILDSNYLASHCIRIIKECNPKFWVIENPAEGRLKEHIGKYKYSYQPWEYESPWTKFTGLWGNFNMPKPLFTNWDDVPKNDKLWIRKGRKKPALVYLHKSAINLIPEFEFAREYIKCDADIRSMCSQGFAKAFYEANK